MSALWSEGSTLAVSWKARRVETSRAAPTQGKGLHVSGGLCSELNETASFAKTKGSSVAANESYLRRKSTKSEVGLESHGKVLLGTRVLWILEHPGLSFLSCHSFSSTPNHDPHLALNSRFVRPTPDPPFALGGLPGLPN